MQLAWLLRTTTHWLLTLGEAALLVWGVALALVLSGWLVWTATWILRRLGVLKLLPSPGFLTRSPDRVAYRTRAGR